jgi:hypothetical protein
VKRRIVKIRAGFFSIAHRFNRLEAKLDRLGEKLDALVTLFALSASAKALYSGFLSTAGTV